MAIQTLDMRLLREQKLNVYEMCLLIAARARQINAERIQHKKENDMMDDVDLYDEADIYDRELMEDMKFEREINPTVIAQDEFFNSKLKAYYALKEEESLDK